MVTLEAPVAQATINPLGCPFCNRFHPIDQDCPLPEPRMHDDEADLWAFGPGDVDGEDEDWEDDGREDEDLSHWAAPLARAALGLR